MSNNITIKNSFMGLFGSKARQLLLLNFFLNPNKKFYVQELSKKFGINAGNLHRELKKMMIAGVISSSNIGNIVQYNINQQSVIYKPLRDIVLKTIGIKEMLKPFFNKIDEVVTVFVYGSYAKGEFDHSSDIDIFVIVSIDLVGLYSKISTELSTTENKIGREINMDYVTVSEFSKQLKQKNPYIRDLLKNQKQFIKGGENDIRLQLSQETEKKL